jgi:GNAT superfamily N-acetyltransferase
MRIVALHSNAEREKLPAAPGLPPLASNQIDDQGADLHLCAVNQAGQVQAHCSLWWRATPRFSGHRVGAIGHYASVDDDFAAALLEGAISNLRLHACTIAIGPMDGNTWRQYRFVTGAGTERPFFLEPANPREWPLQFERAGFTPLANYYSALNTNLAQKDDRIAPHASRLAGHGVRIRTAAGENLDTQLGRIYGVSRVAFAQNFLYTEVPEDSFRAQYSQILPHVLPELILLAERGLELVGYLFAVPDLAQAARGGAVDTFLVKTVAILPHPDLRGLGTVLVSRAHQEGLRAGFRRCIHALMHENNVSRNISGHYAATMRRYTLYSRELAS